MGCKVLLEGREDGINWSQRHAIGADLRIDDPTAPRLEQPVGLTRTRMVPEARVHRWGDKYREAGTDRVSNHGRRQIIGQAIGDLVKGVERTGSYQHRTKRKTIEW